MRNQEIAKAMKLIAEGFNTLAVAFEGAEQVIETPVVEATKEVIEKVANVTPLPTKEAKKEVTEKVEEPKEVATESNNAHTEESLNAMTYNEIKALAKELGVKAVGSKKAIIDNILATVGDVPQVTEEAVVEDENGEVVEQVEEEIEDNDEEVTVEAESLYDHVASDLEGYSDEELADILSDIGVSPKGKRQALLAKIVQAIEEGKLEWESEEEATEEVETAPEPKEEVEEEATEEEFVGTEARRVACEKEIDTIETDLEKENLSHKEVIKFLKDFYNGKYTSQGFDGDVDEYIAIQCDLIDDEGNKHDLADPYYIGDDVYCCAQTIKEVDGDYFCEICGTEYSM